MVSPFSPRLRSWEASVAVDTWPSPASSSAGRTGVPAAGPAPFCWPLTPNAASRASSVIRGIAPNAGRVYCGLDDRAAQPARSSRPRR